jgi:hypothetical protein
VDDKTIVTELLQVRVLREGDYFGNYRGGLQSNEESLGPLLEKERNSSRSIANISVITNTRCEIARLNRLKISSAKTDEILVRNAEKRSSVTDVAEMLPRGR